MRRWTPPIGWRNPIAKAVHFKGLINAVLRRAAREGAEVVASQDAAVLNTPDWLWPRWVAHYGEATARAIAEAHLAVPPLDLNAEVPGGCAYPPLRGRVEIFRPAGERISRRV